MKDELEELTTDASSRKTATDWLMKVISGRKPINLHLNGLAHEEEDDSGAVAVAEKEPAEEPKSGKWLGEFSAEDLCGAPAVPIVHVYSAEASEVTADDVCWVPEERRLKPEPVAEAAPRVLQMAVPGSVSGREPEVREPETPKPLTARVDEGFFRQTSLAAERAPSQNSLDDELTIADISRDPAPYVVEPMPVWGAFTDSFHASEVMDRPITEADISRDWVTQSVEPLEERGKDGVVLPFSFKVLKSKEAVQDNGASAADAAPQKPDLEPVAEESAVLSPEVNGAATVGGVEEPALPEIADSAEVAEAQAAVQPENSAAMEAPPLAPGFFVNGIEMAELVAAAEPEPEAASAAEPQSLETETSPEMEVAAPEAAPEEIATEPSADQPESVFAREGFWEGSVPGEIAASEEGTLKEEASLNMDLKPSQPAAEGEDVDEALDEDLNEAGKLPEEWVSAWKALLRIGSVLPRVAKALPAIESGALGDGAGAPGEVRQDVAGLRLVQYEIRTTVQDHTLQMKRMDEQLGRIRESLESRSSNSADVAENVESMSRLVRIVGAGLGGLLLVLILLVAILLAHGR